MHRLQVSEISISRLAVSSPPVTPQVGHYHIQLKLSKPMQGLLPGPSVIVEAGQTADIDISAGIFEKMEFSVESPTDFTTDSFRIRLQ